MLNDFRRQMPVVRFRVARRFFVRRSAGAEENPMTVRRRIAFLILFASASVLPSAAVGQRVTEEKLVNPDLASPFARVAESVMPSVASIRTVSAFDHPNVGGDLDRFFLPESSRPDELRNIVRSNIHGRRGALGAR